MLSVLSLYSGIGGLDLGLERAGMTVVGQCEIDPFCRRVLQRHWPHVPCHDDVRTLIPWWQSEPRPPVDLIAGGFPCQPHSAAGKRRGTADPGWLWPPFCAVLQALKPPMALIENVPRIRGSGLWDIACDLAHLGFDAEWGCVPAAAMGAAHLRWRFFLIAAHPDRIGIRDESWWGSGQDRSYQAVTGHDGAVWALADTNGAGRAEWPGGLGDEAGRGEPAHSGWWATEPAVDRVASGAPNRLDRMRALGNAVVPQVAQYVGEMIMSSLRR